MKKEKNNSSQFCISKERIERKRDIEVTFRAPDYYNEHYPDEYYTYDLDIIKQCSELYDRYSVKSFIDGSISTDIVFPFNKFLKFIGEYKQMALDFPHEEFMNHFSNNNTSAFSDLVSKTYPKKTITLKTKLVIRMPQTILLGKSDQTETAFIGHSNSVLEDFFCDFFCVANLACPGALDLYKLFFNTDEKLNVDLNGFAWYWTRHSKNIQLAPVQVLNASDVFYWYNNIISSKNSYTPATNALISLVRFSMYDYEEPIDNIFIIHALEALYGGGVIPRSLLKKRINNVLYGKKKIVELHKALDNLYKWRHKLIHGALKMPHPIKTSPKDQSWEKYENEYTKAKEIGFQIVLASLQKLIIEQSLGFNFEEKMSYVKL